MSVVIEKCAVQCDERVWDRLYIAEKATGRVTEHAGYCFQHYAELTAGREAVIQMECAMPEATEKNQVE
jgi:hypothetical protein